MAINVTASSPSHAHIKFGLKMKLMFMSKWIIVLYYTMLIIISNDADDGNDAVVYRKSNSLTNSVRVSFSSFLESCGG